MSSDTLTVALITEVFHGADGPARLLEHLERARALDAQLAVLPELPLDPWVPVSRAPHDADAEPPEGPRQRTLRDAARQAGLAVLGGVIEVDPTSGRRHNTALLVDRAGEVRLRYRKLHLPSEPGFWESDHYAPGDEPPRSTDALGMRLGVQICSDMNRPVGCQLLAAAGAEVVLAPRATPTDSWPRWRLVLRAGAVTSAAYVLSVNRPRPEGAAAIGGPSVAIAPDGRVLLETTEPVATVALRRESVRLARRDYPGSLPLRTGVYASAWSELHDRGRRGDPTPG